MAVKLKPDFSSSPVSGASAQLKPKAPAPKPQQKTNTGGGGSWGPAVQSANTGPVTKQNGGWYNGQQYWAPGQGPQQVSAAAPSDGGGGGEPDWDSQLDSIYNGYLSSLDNMANNANTTYGEDVSNLEKQYTSEEGRYNTQQEQLLGDTATSEDRYNQTLRSAYDDAIRAYNSLAQQAQARFGRGSSAGAAVGELAQQEFFRQQGQIQQKGVQGNEDFAKERGRIKQYVTDQINQLSLYKTTAMDGLKQSLRDQLQAIDSKRTEVQSNKARDKMALLQQAVSAAQAIADGEKQMRKNIAMQSLSQMQQVAGRTFSPQEIVAYLQEFENQFAAAGGVGASNPTQLAVGGGRFTGREDQLQGLNPFGQ